MMEKEDKRKAEWLLLMHPRMINVIKDYEFSMKNKVNGLSLYDLMNAEGGARTGEHGQEIINDVTANSVVLKDKSADIYHLYKILSENIINVIENLADPYEQLICNMLYIEGKTYSDARDYMGKGYRRDLYPLSPTTFAFKRKKGISKISESFMVIGVLEYVVGESGIRSPKNWGFRLSFPKWEDEPQYLKSCQNP